MTTAHTTLGVAPDTTLKEIKAVYRRLAMKHHPDRGGDPATFAELQTAYEALTQRVCPDCEGSAFITTKRGAFVDKKPCPTCWGISTC